MRVDAGGYPVYGAGGELRRASGYLHEGPSVLFGRKGTLDRPILVRGRFWALDTMFYTVLGPRIDPRFLHYCATAMPLGACRTGTAVPSMTREDLAALVIPLPPRPRQRAIADHLDGETARIDALIARHRQLIALLRERRHSLIWTTTRCGSDARRRPRDALADGPGAILPHWTTDRLGRLVAIRTGTSSTAVEVESGGYPVYGSGGEFRRASAYLHDGPSVLFGRKGTIDRPLLVSGRFWTADTMFYTIPGDRIDPRYLWYYAQSMPYGFSSTDAALPSVTKSDLASHRMPVPPIDVQRRLAAHLDARTSRIDTLIAKAEQLVALAHERRHALITAAVTGRIDADPAA